MLKYHIYFTFFLFCFHKFKDAYFQLILMNLPIIELTKLKHDLICQKAVRSEFVLVRSNKTTVLRKFEGAFRSKTFLVNFLSKSLKTNFTKFELSMTFRSRDITE